MPGEVLTETDVVQMDSEELKQSSADVEIDPEELADQFPPFEHHMTVKAKLRSLAKKGVIDYSQVDDIHDMWQSNK